MRKKPDPCFVVADLGTANLALARLAEMKRAVDAENLRLNETIDKLKAHATMMTAPYRAEAAEIEAALASFVATKKEELFGKSRSQSLTFGVIGFRRSSEVKPKGRGTLANLLEKVKALATGEKDDPFTGAIRLKEELNRDVMRTWPEERLAAVGARIAEKDSFYYELKEEKIKEVAA
jgi:phage host-nuclease inhibitor protein Gam